MKSISTIEICTSTTANNQMKRDGLGCGIRQSDRYRLRLKHSSEVYGKIFRPAVIKELLSVVSLSHTETKAHEHLTRTVHGVIVMNRLYM